MRRMIEVKEYADGVAVINDGLSIGKEGDVAVGRNLEVDGMLTVNTPHKTLEVNASTRPIYAEDFGELEIGKLYLISYVDDTINNARSMIALMDDFGIEDELMVFTTPIGAINCELNVTYEGELPISFTLTSVQLNDEPIDPVPDIIIRKLF